MSPLVFGTSYNSDDQPPGDDCVSPLFLMPVHGLWTHLGLDQQAGEVLSRLHFWLLSEVDCCLVVALSFSFAVKTGVVQCAGLTLTRP